MAAQCCNRRLRLGVWERLLVMAQERGEDAKLGMAFLDGSSVRAHRGKHARLALTLDVADQEQIRHAKRRAQERFGRIVVPVDAGYGFQASVEVGNGSEDPCALRCQTVRVDR